MKIVAVSQRVDTYPERNERRDALDQQLSRWVAQAGYVPVPVPNLLSATNVHDWLQVIKPKAVLLSGGNDIGRVLERDAAERCLLAYAKDWLLPVLGICRGMQMMGVWAEAELRPVNGHVRTRHQLSGEITGEVNSYHNYALAECPANFTVLARSEDGEIEAIRHESLPWEGWMWHPEREQNFHSRDIERLRALFA